MGLMLLAVCAAPVSKSPAADLFPVFGEQLSAEQVVGEVAELPAPQPPADAGQAGVPDLTAELERLQKQIDELRAAGAKKPTEKGGDKGGEKG
ncbi:MAG: hypothetical protein ACKOWG_01310, partial [Planctomycetia bacterium]